LTEKLEMKDPKVMTAAFVATAIVNQLKSASSGQIILPKELSIAPAIRGLALWLQEIIRDGQRKTVPEGQNISTVRAKK
jgi:hypothetical protein